MPHIDLANYWRQQYRQLLTCILLFSILQFNPAFNLFEQSSHYMLAARLLLGVLAVTVALLIANVSWYEYETGTSSNSKIFLIGFSTVAFLELMPVLNYAEVSRLWDDSSIQRILFLGLICQIFVILVLISEIYSLRVNFNKWIALVLSGVLGVVVIWLSSLQTVFVPQICASGVCSATAIKFCEYALFSADILLGITFISLANDKNKKRYFSLATSCFFLATGELFFVEFQSSPDLLNNFVFGCLFKVISYVVLYQALFVHVFR